MSPNSEPPAIALPIDIASRHRPWHKTAMHWIRRLHLYSGLFMFPWVLLYGTTAFLFNHPTAFPDQKQISFGRTEIESTPLQRFPKADELARTVVAALETQPRKSGRTELYRLVEPNKAAYSEEFVFAHANADGQQHNVRISVVDGTGRISTRGIAPSTDKFPIAQNSLKIDDLPANLVKDSLPTILNRAGLAAGDVSVTFSPDLTFLMEAEGKRWNVTYNTLTGEMTGRPADDGTNTLTTRRFLLELHLAHGFPTSPGVRWFWAVAVDVMFVSMVFWALSGVLMFWQIKAVRVWGIAVILGSAAAAITLIVGMHGEFAR